MQRLTTTPFGRRTGPAVQTVAQKAMQSVVDRPVSGSVDKWQVLRDLTKARAVFGLGSRTLAVLSALLSFHPARHLGGNDPLIVFPSNRTLSERAYGMSEATLRRHLAALVSTGLLLRHDSPNGKRYAARDRSGSVIAAFGFDLRPLLIRHAEIAQTAQDIEDNEAKLRRLREAVVLRLRDCTTMLETCADVSTAHQETLAEFRRMLRRKLNGDILNQALSELSRLQHTLETSLPKVIKTDEPSGKNSETERHYQNSDPDTFKNKHNNTNPRPSLHSPARDPYDKHYRIVSPTKPSKTKVQKRISFSSIDGTVDLAKVLSACPSIQSYSKTSIDTWEDFHRSASQVSPWLGIETTIWNEAQEKMGPLVAAITVAAILERSAKINTPAAYLRSLCHKAHTHEFNPVAMVHSLLHAQQLEPS